MQVIDSIPALRAIRPTFAQSVGFVPTMGALHHGHLALVKQAKAENAHVIASIFVNPTQFAPNEDYAGYPRHLEQDLAQLQAAGVDVVFTPTPALMYPPNYQTYVDVTDLTQYLEGAQRPAHFRGVTTVVSKLFNLVQPQIAYFGQKDAQQVAVIQRMVHDLNFPVEIAICPTIREPDGLALSSRNAYLTPPERAAAPVLYRALKAAADAHDNGQRNPDVLRNLMQEVLAAEPLAQVQYVSVASPQTLQEQTTATNAPLLVSLAVKIGRARLIDNCLLPFSLNTRQGLAQTFGNLDPSS